MQDYSEVRLFGPQRSLVARLMPWLVALLILAVFGAASVWVRQQEAVRREAEARAESAEARLSMVQTTLTAIVRAQATAQATALARANEPGPALERALDLVFAAYQEPSEARFRALNDAFTPAARAFFQNEAEHLVSSGRHLGGTSTFSVEIVSSTPRGERADVRTRERWTYDERDSSDRQLRCIREESEQTYTLRRMPGGWLVEDVQLGTTRRAEC